MSDEPNDRDEPSYLLTPLDDQGRPCGEPVELFKSDNEIPHLLPGCPDPSLFKGYLDRTLPIYGSPTLVRVRRNTRHAWTIAVLAIAATVYLVSPAVSGSTWFAGSSDDSNPESDIAPGTTRGAPGFDWVRVPFLFVAWNAVLTSVSMSLSVPRPARETSEWPFLDVIESGLARVEYENYRGMRSTGALRLLVRRIETDRPMLSSQSIRFED